MESSSSTPPLTRQNAMAAKRPRTLFGQDFERDSEALLPDLADFFAEFEVPLEARPALCRSYASYVQTLLKQQKEK